MNEVMESSHSAAPNRRIEQMIRAAWAKLTVGEKVAAAVAFNEIAEEAGRCCSANSVQLADVLGEVGVGLFMVGPGHTHNAVLYLTQALKIYTREKGAGSLECARIHRQMSAVYASSGMHQQALLSLRRAAEIFETLLVPNFGVQPGSSREMRQQQLATRMEEFANARSSPTGALPRRSTAPGPSQ